MRIVVLLLLGLPAGTLPLAGQHPLNLGFETLSEVHANRAWGWAPSGFAPGGEWALDSTLVRSGARSLLIRRETDGFTALQYWIPPNFAWGTDVEVSWWARSVGAARPLPVLETWSDEIRADTAVAGEVDANGWRQYRAVLSVDSSVHSIVVKAGMTGHGHVWIDDLSVAVAGRARSSAPVATAPSPSDLRAIQQRTVALNTYAPSTDHTEDLQAFADIVGNARLVALGETTHGTHEFFLLKHRLLEYLVHEHGFSVFLIEANQLAAEVINNYVRGAPGSAEDVMRTMFAVWNTEGMADLINWMRSHNVRHADHPVEFIGFDMQDPRRPIDSISVFLRERNPALRRQADSLYGAYRAAWDASQYPWAPDSVRSRWQANADRMYRVIEERAPAWLAQARTRADSVRIDWTLQNANVVRQAALSALTMELRTRDSAMAENIRWSMDRRPAGARAVVWAHDAHISKAAAPNASYYRGTTMGAYLTQLYGTDYRPFGLLTYRGTYSGWLNGQPREVPLFTASEGTLEHALHVIGEGSDHVSLTDLRNASTVPWLVEPRAIRLIGYAAEDWGFATPISVGHQYDGVFFVDTTTRSRLVPRR